MKKAVAFGAIALMVLVNMAPVSASAATQCTTVKTYVVNSCTSGGKTTTTINGSTTTGTKTTGTTTTGSNNTTTTNTGTTTSTSTTSTSSYAQQVVDLVNKERAKQGLSALKIDKNVEKAALVRAKEIQSSFSHTRPNGKSFTTALTASGVTYNGAGENIAWGQKTPQEVMTGWMNSPGHRANILNKNFKYIGVGNLQNSSGTQYWVQLFTY